MSSSSRPISLFTGERPLMRVDPLQTQVPNAQLGSKEYIKRRRERLVHLQVLNHGSRSGAMRKSSRLLSRRNDVKPTQTIPDSTPTSPSATFPSTPSMPRERMSPPLAPRASRNGAGDLGTPTPPPRRTRVTRDELLTASSLFRVKCSSTVTVNHVEVMTDDESDAWYENMRDAFEGASSIRGVKLF